MDRQQAFTVAEEVFPLTTPTGLSGIQVCPGGLVLLAASDLNVTMVLHHKADLQRVAALCLAALTQLAARAALEGG